MIAVRSSIITLSSTAPHSKVNIFAEINEIVTLTDYLPTIY
jgi:hypothetical protein